MKTYLKSLFVGGVIAALAGTSLIAQVALEDFSNLTNKNNFVTFYGAWASNGSTEIGSATPISGITQGSDSYTIGAAGATNSDTAKLEIEFANPVSIAGYSYLALTAEALTTNAAPSVRVILLDDSFRAAYADFSASAFPNGGLTTSIQSLTFNSGFNVNQVSLVQITGNLPGGTSVFNFTFGDLTAVSSAAVPEPSTYAQIALGLGALGLIAYRRRKTA